MVIQNITIPTNITSIAGMGTFVNTATSGLFGVGVCFGLFTIIWVGLTIGGFDPVKGGLGASLVCTFVAFFLISLLWMSPNYLFVFIGLDVLFGVMAMLRGAQDPY